MSEFEVAGWQHHLHEFDVVEGAVLVRIVLLDHQVGVRGVDWWLDSDLALLIEEVDEIVSVDTALLACVETPKSGIRFEVVLLG